ncbi:MAG: DUF1513 domain-containing protein [Pseudomonadota bacterium]
MPTRRAVVAGLAASASMSGATWADAGAPSHVSAAMDGDGSFALYGLHADGTRAFRVALPSRGHAAAVHPSAPEAVAFARRPGTFALVLDCVEGAVIHALRAPAGRHFYGHGAFSADGAQLFTTENEIETGAGRVGVWARGEGYRRAGEFNSGGTGPHELLRIPGTQRLAIANGGIRTHPDQGRTKLNLDTMRPNLTIATEAGEILDQAAVPEDIHQNSLRHLAVRADGLVACAFQWQGDVYDAPSLLAFYRGGGDLAFAAFDDALHRGLVGYAGSVAFSASGQHVALTSPRGGLLVSVEVDTGEAQVARQTDICGVARGAPGLVATDGQGNVHHVAPHLTRLATHPVAFDNHLIAV